MITQDDCRRISSGLLSSGQDPYIERIHELFILHVSIKYFIQHQNFSGQDPDNAILPNPAPVSPEGGMMKEQCLERAKASAETAQPPGKTSGMNGVPPMQSNGDPSKQ